MHRIDPELHCDPLTSRPLGQDPCTLWLSSHGRIQDMSDRARAWLACPDAGLRVGRHGALEAPQAPALLASLYDRARTQGRSMTALGRAHRLPLTLCCGLVDEGLKLVVHAPELVAVDEAALQEVFQLTVAEAQVAALLGDGQSCAQIAARLGVQPNTVLTHVKRCLAKTGCARQGQLISLLLRSVACRSRSLDGAPLIPGEPAPLRAPPALFG